MANRVTQTANVQIDIGWRQRLAKERAIAGRPPPAVDPFANSLSTLIYSEPEPKLGEAPARVPSAAAAPPAPASVVSGYETYSRLSQQSVRTPSAISGRTPSIRSSDATEIARNKIAELQAPATESNTFHPRSPLERCHGASRRADLARMSTRIPLL
jgi:hypothetical protein